MALHSPVHAVSVPGSVTHVSTDHQHARASLGARLRELRTDAGLTGREVARRLDWPPSKVSKLETGRQTPSTGDLEAWARIVERPDAAHELCALLRSFETRYRTWKRQLATGHRDARAPTARPEAAVCAVRDPSDSCPAAAGRWVRE
ncbi:helix-turn-helix domain-containing protein [Streptodolium elevatio]